jgi:hypothetical protein
MVGPGHDRCLVLLLLGAAACASPASGPIATNVRGVRIVGGATLSWDPAQAATGYTVHFSYLPRRCGRQEQDVCPRLVEDHPVPPGATSYTLNRGGPSSQVRMWVTATSTSGEGPASASLEFSDSGPGGNATVDIGSVHLHWQDPDLALGPTTILRSAGGGEPVTIASSVPAGDYTDSTVQPDTRYSYQLIAETADSRVQEMVSLDVSTRLVAPGLTLACDPGRAVLVTAVADAADYLVGTSSTPGGPYQFVFVSPGRVDPGCSSACYLVAVAADASGVRGATSPEIHMHARPADIDVFAAEMRVGRVRLSWPPSQGAARYDVYRADPAAGPPDAALASTSQTSFDDATGVPFHSYRYWVAGISADGCGGSILGLGSLAFSTTAPEQMSAGASPVPGAAPLARQTFTVGQSGQLVAIELGAAGEDPIYGVRPIPSVAIRKGPFLVARASLLWAPPAPGAIPLAADEVRGIFYDLSGAGLLVSAGEHLAIEIADGPGYLVTDDAYAGGSIATYEVADSTRDLQFKTFVVPASASSLRLTAQDN